MEQFINPKSMLTPGIAGAIMMFISNALCFAFPGLPFPYVAMLLSFVLGLVVFKIRQLGYGERTLYWILNSLIIFATGVGTSSIGGKAEDAWHSAAPARVSQVQPVLSSISPVSAAYAQGKDRTTDRAAGAPEPRHAASPEQKDVRRGSATNSNDASGEKRAPRVEDNSGNRSDRFFKHL